MHSLNLPCRPEAVTYIIIGPLITTSFFALFVSPLSVHARIIISFTCDLHISAHKIHISEVSNEELEKDGGFQMKLRGTLDIKVG